MSLLPPIDRAALAALDDRQDQRVEVQIPGGTRLILLRMPPCKVSASDIRRRLKQRLTVSNLLPASVESYIMGVNLYQEASDHTGV
jgi:nicotinic acid mononucleotide adenylyltransferase